MLSRRTNLILITLCFMVASYNALSLIKFYPEMRLELVCQSADKNQKWVLRYGDAKDTSKVVTPLALFSEGQGARPVSFILPTGVSLDGIRLDPGRSDSSARITRLRVNGFLQKPIVMGPQDILPHVVSHDPSAAIRDGVLELSPDGMQKLPSISLDLGAYAELARKYKSRLVRFALVLIFSLMFYYALGRSEFIDEKISGHTAYNIILSGSFVILVSLPLVMGALHTEPSGALDENRMLADRPELTMKGLFRFPRQYEDFFNDTFGMRGVLVRWQNKLTSQTMGVSNKMVLIGSDGWLFFRFIALDDYKCTNPFTEEQLGTIRKNLLARKRWLAERGIRFYVTIAPNKAGIYPEYLPSFIKRIGNTCRYDQIAGLFSPDKEIELIDLRPALYDAKRDMQSYFRNDAHWNSYGAMAASRALLQAISRDFPSVPVPDMDSFTVRAKERRGGDLAKLIAMEKDMVEMDFVPEPAGGFQSSETLPGNYMNPNRNPACEVTARERAGSKLPRLLMIRDSFANWMIPYMSEGFSRSVYPWTYAINQEIIDEEKPDVVVLEIVERHLELLLLPDPFRNDFEETMRFKSPGWTR